MNLSDSPVYWASLNLDKNRCSLRPPDGAPRVEWALHYAALGLYVFPCCMPTADEQCGCGRRKGPHIDKEIAKAPLVNDWPNEATRDPVKILKWWRDRWTNANIGGLDNERSGILVVDNDKDSADARDLHKVLIANTRVHRSGGADYKWHAIFLRPPDLVIPARHTTELGINLESS